MAIVRSSNLCKIVSMVSKDTIDKSVVVWWIALMANPLRVILLYKPPPETATNSASDVITARQRFQWEEQTLCIAPQNRSHASNIVIGAIGHRWSLNSTVRWRDQRALQESIQSLTRLSSFSICVTSRWLLSRTQEACWNGSHPQHRHSCRQGKQT